MTTERPTPPPDGWVAIGHLRRAHGLKGEVFVQLLRDRDGIVVPGAEFFGAGQVVVVESTRRTGKNRIIAKLDRVRDRTTAEAMRDVELFSPASDDAADTPDDLIGKRVVDQHGNDRGVCVALVANPAADLIEVDSGALIPPNFVTSIEGDVISVDVPDGLFEVQLDDD